MICLPKRTLATITLASLSLAATPSNLTVPPKPVDPEKLAVAPVASQSATKTAAENNADWRSEVGTLRVGLAASDPSLNTVRKAQPFRIAMERALGIPVQITVLPDQFSLAQRQIAGRLDYAIHSTTSFAATWHSCQCIDPIVAPVSSDGSIGFRTVLLSTRKTATTLSELTNTLVAVPGKHSVSGYKFAKHQLSTNGVEADLEKWSLTSSDSADAAVRSIKNGAAHAIVGWQPYTREKQTGNENPAASEETISTRGTQALLRETGAETHAVWQSSPFFHGPHTVRSDLPLAARQRLSKFLTQLVETNLTAYEAIEAHHSGGFEAVTLDDYRNAIAFIRSQLDQSNDSIATNEHVTVSIN